MPDSVRGTGNATKDCIIWRSPRTSTNPRNGRTDPAKIHLDNKKIASRSMIAELTMSSAFAAAG